MDKRYMALATSMLVLKLLDRQSMYGYQIIRELEQQSQNVFRLQEGTLYPVLHALEQQVLLRCMGIVQRDGDKTAQQPIR